MTALFVTATGTGVGKTFVTAALIARLRATGRSACALKPVASGFDDALPQASDSGILLDALGLPIDRRTLNEITPWRFAAPLSPDMAATREGRRIDFEQLVGFCRRPRDAQVTLIEGIGGVMVPLDARHTVLDWIAASAAPVLLVAGSYLGTLSHTLSAAGVLEARGCPIMAIVVSESTDQPVAAEETAAALRRFVSAPVVVVRRCGGPAAAARAHAVDFDRLLDPLL